MNKNTAIVVTWINAHTGRKVKDIIELAHFDLWKRNLGGRILRVQFK